MAEDMSAQMKQALDAESQQTMMEKAELIPDAIEPLQPERIALLQQMVNKAGMRLMQQPPQEVPVAPEAQGRLPPEVAIPAMGMLTFFGSNDAPEAAKRYARDFIQAARSNDGLLEMAAALEEASRDEALMASLIHSPHGEQSDG